jgi:hypothetical protein
MTSAADAMESVLAANPVLNDHGFGLFDVERLTYSERVARLAKDRAEMLSPYSLDDFERARCWLRTKPRTVDINKSAGSSYGLKHVAEVDIGYTTNGVFIAAAMAEGFKVKRCYHDSPNAWINISSKGLQKS